MRRTKLLIATAAALVALGGVAEAQTQAVLPNGMTQFADGNGAPYAGGHVYMYVPHTTTPKATYQDPNGVTPNANPITLDANGRAILWGSGEYRQVLQDLNGVVVWDQLTLANTSTSGAGGSVIWYGTATGTANAITLATPAGFVGTDGQTIGFIASASNNASATINASGFGSVLVEKNSNAGPVGLSGGEIITGNLVFATYSVTANAFILQASTPSPGFGVATAIASATTTDLGTIPSHNANVTGVTTITGFGSSASLQAPLYLVQFSGALTLVQSSALLLPGGASTTVAIGDSAWLLYQGSGNWQLLQHMPATVYQITQSPQVRLSTTSGAPLSTPSGTGTATVYAVPYTGIYVPIWNGVSFVETPCAALSNVLANAAVGNAGPVAAVAGSVYDLVAWNNGTACVLTRDVAWSDVHTPAAGDAMARVRGILVNSVSISNGPAAGFGTYLGTIATDAGGVTVTFNPNPAAASTGPALGAWVGLWNEYNRVAIAAEAQDSAASWAYNSATWAALDASNNNRVTFVCGQPEDGYSVFGTVGTSTGNSAGLGLGLDSVTVVTVGNVGTASGASANSVSVGGAFAAVLGQHYVQALQATSVGAVTYVGASSAPAAMQQEQLTAHLKY